VAASLREGTLFFRAVFTDDASEDHLECARVACTEVLAQCPPETQLEEIVERNETAPWKGASTEDLLFLRYGELSDT
jgi:hypothetical protein